jgi:hypothetical protein
MKCRICQKDIEKHRSHEIMKCMRDAGYPKLSYTWASALTFGVENGIILRRSSNMGLSVLLLLGNKEAISTSEPIRAIYGHFLSKVYITEQVEPDAERESPSTPVA